MVRRRRKRNQKMKEATICAEMEYFFVCFVVVGLDRGEKRRI